MMRHAFKLVWNRKRANGLVVLEIFVAFLVLFAVVVLGAHFADNARRPLGFDYADVWEISVDTRSSEASSEGASPEDLSETTRQVLGAARSLDEVVGVSTARTTPYGSTTTQNVLELDGVPVEFDVDDVSDDFATVMGLDVVEGRWFGREDDGDNGVPVVLNAAMAKRTFGDASPIGKSISQPADDKKLHVVGVVSEYRRRGEYAAPGLFVFSRSRAGDEAARPVQNLLVRTKPGTPRDFEERLMSRLRKAAPTWSFVARPVAEARASSLRLQRAPIAAFGVIALFLILMVGLGLTGVLWQNVTQRTREMGLRRATGATVRDIHWQILGELLVVTSLGVGVGVVVVAQFPLLDVLGFVRSSVYSGSIAASVVALYALTLACGLYPCRMAASGRPADALRDE